MQPRKKTSFCEYISLSHRRRLAQREFVSSSHYIRGALRKERLFKRERERERNDLQSKNENGQSWAAKGREKLDCCCMNLINSGGSISSSLLGCERAHPRARGPAHERVCALHRH